MSKAEAVRDAFLLHAEQRPNVRDTALGLAIHVWLDEGDATTVSGGDFDVYLQGVILIIDDWLQNPSRMKNWGWNLSVLIDPRDSGVPEYLDRAYYQQALSRET